MIRARIEWLNLLVIRIKDSMALIILSLVERGIVVLASWVVAWVMELVVGRRGPSDCFSETFIATASMALLESICRSLIRTAMSLWK